jgi:hypothetical protein
MATSPSLISLIWKNTTLSEADKGWRYAESKEERRMPLWIEYN